MSAASSRFWCRIFPGSAAAYDHDPLCSFTPALSHAIAPATHLQRRAVTRSPDEFCY
ncbi:MAG: hypothetical protein ACFB14_21450 [Leptolyngbyaceae cyanobacterium]